MGGGQMKKRLKPWTSKEGLFHRNKEGAIVVGPGPNMINVSMCLSGDCSGLSGDFEHVTGDCSKIYGIVNKDLMGDVTGLSGNITKIVGYCSRLIGDLDRCVTDEERKEKDTDIKDLIEIPSPIKKVLNFILM